MFGYELFLMQEILRESRIHSTKEFYHTYELE